MFHKILDIMVVLIENNMPISHNYKSYYISEVIIKSNPPQDFKARLNFYVAYCLPVIFSIQD